MKLSEEILAAHKILREQPRQAGCISYLQRKLACSYNRAALLIGVLEEAKVLSVPDHAGYRRWLITDVDAAVAALKDAI